MAALQLVRAGRGAAPPADFAADVCAGLARRPKRIASKYFYDARGSALFERICAQPEYYLTRTELAILHAHADEIAAAVGPRALVLEYGSGSGLKTRRLLDALVEPVAYVPVEISRAALDASTAALAPEFPELEILPLCADFTGRLAPPAPRRQPRRTLVYFPGSTLGNFGPDEAAAVLRGMRVNMGAGGLALVGIDLQKDPRVIEAAYNDAAGVTAEFTLNLLARINRELGADFDLTRFRHRAAYHALAGRIETHLVSQVAQVVHVAGQRFDFAAGEAMLVEYSCKYSPDGFARLAHAAGLRVVRNWTDPADWFANVLLARA